MTNEKRDILAEELAAWVGEDLTKEQIQSAIWGISMIQRNNPEMLENAAKEVYADVEEGMGLGENN